MYILVLCIKYERKVKKISLSICKMCSEVSEVSEVLWIKCFILGILMVVLKWRILLR